MDNATKDNAPERAFMNALRGGASDVVLKGLADLCPWPEDEDEDEDNTGVTIDKEGDTIKVDGHPVCSIAMYDAIRKHVIDEISLNLMDYDLQYDSIEAALNDLV